MLGSYKGGEGIIPFTARVVVIVRRLAIAAAALLMGVGVAFSAAAFSADRGMDGVVGLSKTSIRADGRGGPYPNAGAVVLQCRDVFGPNATGTIVITPSGSLNVNCGGPRPGAVVLQCRDIFGPDVTGTIVLNPAGGSTFHCKFS